MDDLEKQYERAVDTHIFGSQGRKMSIGEGHSFGSQGRKISIGIIVDSGLKTISGAVTERKIAISSSENGAKKSSSRIIISTESRGDEVITPNTKRNTPFPEARSPWISVKSHDNTPTCSPKQDPRFASPVCRLNELNRVNASSITHLLPEIVLSTTGNEKTLSPRKSPGELEKTTIVDMCSPVEASVTKENPMKTANSETLKMKLWEALGTDYPTNKKLSNSQHIHEVNPGSQLPPLSKDPPQGYKEKPNSDSIETDSEGLTVTTRRPNTRSSAKKRATKKPPRKNQKNRRSKEQNCENKTNSSLRERNDLSQSKVGNGFLASNMWNNCRKNGVKLGTIGIFENGNPQESENINDEAHFKKEASPNPKGGYASLPFTNNKHEGTMANQTGEKYSNKPPLTRVHCGSPFTLHNKIEEPSGKLETKGSPSEKSHIEGDTPTLKTRSLVFNTAKSERRKGMESDKNCCDDMNHSSELQHDGGKKHLPVDKMSPTYQNGDHHSLNLQMGNKQEFIHRNLQEEKSPVQSPIARGDDVDNLFIPEKVDSKEESGNSELKNEQDDTQSPTFEFKISSKHRNSSSNSFPTTNHKEQGSSSPVTMRKFSASDDAFKDVGLRGSSVMKPIFDTRETSTHKESSESSMEGLHYESSEDGLLPNDRYKDTPISCVKRTDRRRKMPVYSSEDRDSESSNGGSPLSDTYKGGPRGERLLEDEYAAKLSKFMFPPARKRPYGLEGTQFCGSPSPRPTGSQDTDDDIQTPSSEQNEDDEMARAVALFVLALEKIQKKTKFVARKKSAEIVMSVSEAVQAKFQNIYSQIQTDVQKLTTLTQAKRRRLEARFEEHQESMKRLHERFKDEVGQHLKDCILSLQGLEAHQIEFKGATENQKASHMKILSETEDAINKQIQDAQGKISTINKVGREKMMQLKCVITECLKEDLLR